MTYFEWFYVFLATKPVWKADLLHIRKHRYVLYIQHLTIFHHTYEASNKKKIIKCIFRYICSTTKKSYKN